MKHKTRTKALSWLLSLALVLSLTPGLTLTVKADDPKTYQSFTLGDEQQDGTRTGTVITANTTYIYTYEAKNAQTITASDVTATYGDTGKRVSGTTDGDGAISYAVKSDSDVVDVNSSTGALTIVKAGTATVTVTAAETATYAAATKDVTVTISKATPNYTVPTGLTATYGQTLADMTLPGADNGTWAWKESSTSVGNVGAHTFQATFTPNDTDNCNTVSDIDVTVTVGKAPASVTTAPTAKTGLTYTGEGQTLVNAEVLRVFEEGQEQGIGRD